MESALEKALSNPGLGVLLLDDTNRALAEDVEQLRQEVAGMDQVWKAENEVHKHNTQRTAEMNQMLQDIQASCLGSIFDMEVTSFILSFVHPPLYHAHCESFPLFLVWEKISTYNHMYHTPEKSSPLQKFAKEILPYKSIYNK